MEYKNEKLGCSFELPDRPTVRQQLHYFAAINTERDEPSSVQLWPGVAVLVSNWQCEILPDPKTSLDDMTDQKQTFVVMWAGSTVLGHLNRLDNLPNG